jgi:hypothetical protein
MRVLWKIVYRPIALCKKSFGKHHSISQDYISAIANQAITNCYIHMQSQLQNAEVISENMSSLELCEAQRASVCRAWYL